MKKTILLLVAMLFLSNGCNKAKQYQNKPDDSVSNVVCSLVGKEVYYRNKITIGDVTRYNFLLANNDEKNLKDLVASFNVAIEGNTNKVKMCIGTVVSYGIEYPITLTNYSEDDIQVAYYKGLKVLELSYPKATPLSFYTDPNTFLCLEDIRILRIDGEMQKKAEDEEIDWYEEWPELESIESLPL